MRVQDEEGSEEDVGEDAEKDIVKLERKAKVEWDCESILSTYSNLYNHPTLIKEHVNQQRKVLSSTLYMYITCISHVYHMYITCILHAYCMYIACVLHVYCIIAM